MHRTLKEAMEKPKKDGRSQQKMFDELVRDFNHDRPHEALGQHPPATRYENSRQPFGSGLIEPDYPIDWPKRQVRSNGDIKWQGGMIFLGEAFIGQTVGLQPAGRGLWVVRFMDPGVGSVGRESATGATHFDQSIIATARAARQWGPGGYAAAARCQRDQPAAAALRPLATGPFNPNKKCNPSPWEKV